MNEYRIGFFTVMVPGLCLLAAMLSACGGEADPGDATPEDIGTASQGLIFAPAGAVQPGIKPTSFRTCVQGDSGQNCVVPSQKDFVYSFASGSETAKSQ